MEIKYKNIATYKHKKATLKYYADLSNKVKDTSFKIFISLEFVSFLAKDLAANPIKDVLYRACFGIMPSLQQLKQDTPKANKNIGKMVNLEPSNVMLIKNMLKMALLLTAVTTHFCSQYINKKLTELDKKTS